MKNEEEDFILISKPKYRGVYIISKSQFFSQEITIKCDESKLIFTRIGLDFEGKRRKFSANKYKNWFSASLQEEIPLGKYYFDLDETTEDEVVVYYN